MEQPKPRVIKDYDKLDREVQEQIKLAYPYGFAKSLIFFTNKDGIKVSALPFETNDKYYLVRMTQQEARQIIQEDADYDELGQLKESVRDDYEDKYSDLEYMSDYISDADAPDDDLDEIADDSVADEIDDDDETY